MTILGADVSHRQNDAGPLNFAKVKASGRDFVVIKATEGTGFVDPKFAANRAAAHAAGLIVGLYHFARAGNAAAEAAYFLSKIGALQPGEFLVLDWEVSAADPVGWCKTWLDAVTAATGVRAFVYLNASVEKSFNWAPVVGGNYPLWLAKYDGDPATQTSVVHWPAIAMKQYTDAATVPGISGPVDADSFFGATSQLLAYGKGGTPPQEDWMTTPISVDNLKAIKEFVWRDPLPEDQGVAILRLIEMDQTLGGIGAKVDALAAQVAAAQEPTVDPAVVTQAVTDWLTANVDKLGAAVAAHLQLTAKP